jgi:gas vesicle protein
MASFVRFFIGFLSGGVIAFGLMILFTPLSGEELRQQIMQRSSSFQEEVKNAASQRKAELQAKLEALRSGRNG